MFKKYYCIVYGRKEDKEAKVHHRLQCKKKKKEEGLGRRRRRSSIKYGSCIAFTKIKLELQLLVWTPIVSIDQNPSGAPRIEMLVS